MATITTAISSKPICSVCIANYNGIGLIEDCIDSVLAQDCGFEIEIIIHDDASTDDSVALIRERYPQVKLIESKQNVGFCISNNRMVAQANGEFILLLNNDAGLLPDALKTLFEHASRHPPGILTLPQYDWQSGKLVDRGCLLDLFYNPVPNLARSRKDVAMTIGACLWIPLAVWQELGGLAEWFESIAEDMHLCCKARLAGYCVQVTSTSGYRHRQGKSFGGNRITQGQLASTFRRRRLSERNKTFVMLICTPAIILVFILPLHLVLLTIEGIGLSLFRQDLRIWQEIYGNVFQAIWRYRKLLLAEHKYNMSRRKITTRNYLSGFSPLPRKLVLLFRHGLPSVN